MKYLLDTNAVSEAGRPYPDPGFMRWFESVDDHDLCLSAVTVGEMRRGIALLDDGRRKDFLSRLNAALIHRFGDQVLAVDLRVAEVWGELSARLKKAGLVAGAPDELIAATALAHDAAVVTRNTRHFEASDREVLSPWSA